MAFYTLQDFQRLCSLSDSALLWLLKNGKLSCKLDPEKGILIDLDSVDTRTVVEAIAKRKREFLSSEKKDLIQKASIVAFQQIKEIVEQVKNERH